MITGRQYRIMRERDGVVFVCDFCSHRVELWKFGDGRQSGTGRTRGASEMIKHIRESHPERYRGNP